MGKFDFIEEDRRIMEQKLRQHKISPQELQKFLKGLADEKQHGEELIINKDSRPSSEEKES